MKTIMLYTLSTCPWCRKAKKFFADLNVPFDFIDYDLADRPTQDDIMKKMDSFGVTGFPCVCIGEKVIEGYSPDRFKRALEEE